MFASSQEMSDLCQSEYAQCGRTIMERNLNKLIVMNVNNLVVLDSLDVFLVVLLNVIQVQYVPHYVIRVVKNPLHHQKKYCVSLLCL